MYSDKLFVSLLWHITVVYVYDYYSNLAPVLIYQYHKSNFDQDTEIQTTLKAGTVTIPVSCSETQHELLHKFTSNLYSFSDQRKFFP